MGCLGSAHQAGHTAPSHPIPSHPAVPTGAAAGGARRAPGHGAPAAGHEHHRRHEVPPQHGFASVEASVPAGALSGTGCRAQGAERSITPLPSLPSQWSMAASRGEERSPACLPRQRPPPPSLRGRRGPGCGTLRGGAHQLSPGDASWAPAPGMPLCCQQDAAGQAALTPVLLCRPWKPCTTCCRCW